VEPGVTVAQGVLGLFRSRRGATPPDDERRMTVTEHLQELRRVLIVSLIAWVAGTAVSAVFTEKLIGLLENPLRTVLAHQTSRLISGLKLTGPIVTSPTELFTIPLKVAMLGGLVLSLPIVLWQVWTFVAPGLRPAERRFAGPFIASALVLFAAGSALGYFLMPIWLNILITFIGGNATYFPDLNQYLSFLLTVIVAFGITFELPVVVCLLGLLGIVSSRWLQRRRKVVWAVIIVGAELVTPGADPFSPLLLAVPLLGLFELSVLVLARVLHR
jgi:sec-independent protein translocase protein TatC